MVGLYMAFSHNEVFFMDELNFSPPTPLGSRWSFRYKEVVARTILRMQQLDVKKRGWVKPLALGQADWLPPGKHTKTTENHLLIIGNTYKWPCSIAMFVYQRVMIWHRYDQFLMGYDGFYAGSMVVLWLYDYMTVCIVTWQGHDYMTFFWGCIMMALGWFCGALCLEGFLLPQVAIAIVVSWIWRRSWSLNRTDSYLGNFQTWRGCWLTK